MNAHSAALAFPSTGGAVTRMTMAPAAFADDLLTLGARLQSNRDVRHDNARGGTRTHTLQRTIGFKPTASDQFRHPGRAKS